VQKNDDCYPLKKAPQELTIVQFDTNEFGGPRKIIGPLEWLGYNYDRGP
jgi:hypothetical protein